MMTYIQELSVDDEAVKGKPVEQKLRLFYGSAPHGAGCRTRVLGCVSQNRLVGTMGCVCAEYISDHAAGKGVHVCDWWVEKEYRACGIAFQLLVKAQEGADFCIGSSLDPVVQNLFKALRWPRFSHYRVILHVSPISKLRRFLPRGRVFSPLYSSSLGAGFRSLRGKADMRMVRVEAFTEAHEQICLSNRGQGVLGGISREHLNWRYLCDSRGRYRIYEIWEREAVLGFVVLGVGVESVTGVRFGSIAEIVPVTYLAGRMLQLIRAAVAMLKKEGVAFIELRLSDPELIEALEREWCGPISKVEYPLFCKGGRFRDGDELSRAAVIGGLGDIGTYGVEHAEWKKAETASAAS